MPEYDMIKVSKGADVDKTNGFRECIIYYHWYFLNINVRFQPEVCNGCHNLKQKAMNFND